MEQIMNKYEEVIKRLESVKYLTDISDAMILARKWYTEREISRDDYTQLTMVAGMMEADWPNIRKIK
jgi:hypothetical protein